MSIKSALFAAITTVVMILVLGNQWVFERQLESSSGFAADTRRSLTGQLRWQVWGDRFDPDLRGATLVRLLLLVLVAAVLGGLAGRARPLAAFVGGWGAFAGAAFVSAGVYALVVDERYRTTRSDDVIDRFTFGGSFGGTLVVWLGWLVGLAVMLGSFGKGQPKPATRAAPPPPPGGWNPPGPHDPPGTPFGRPDPPSEPSDPPAPGSSFDRPGSSPPPPPPGPSGGPVIGTPPDRTRVFGEPPADQDR